MAKKLTLETVFSAVDRITGPAKTMQSKLQAFNTRLQSGLGKTTAKSSLLGDAIKGMLPALSAAAALKAIDSFASRGDDIARNAGILGLAARAYQELSYAAKMADVDQDAFTAATKKLNANLGQLKARQGSLYTTLARTNPALARQLMTAKTTDDAFSLVAKAIAKETNVQRRASIAVAAFGKSGQDLIPMLEDLGKLRQEAQDSGTIIDDADIATAERLDDSLKRLKAQGMRVANEGLGILAEKLAPVVEKMSTWLQANKDLVNTKIDKTFEIIGGALDFMGKAWDSGVIPGILGGVAAFKALNTVLAITNALAAGNPVMLTATAIAALIGLIVANWDKITGFFDRMTSGGPAGVPRETSKTYGQSSSYGTSGLDSAPTSSEVDPLYASVAPRKPAPVSAPIAPVSTSSSRTESYSERMDRVSFDFSGLPPGVAAKVQTTQAPAHTLNRGSTLSAVSGGAH